MHARSILFGLLLTVTIPTPCLFVCLFFKLLPLKGEVIEIRSNNQLLSYLYYATRFVRSCINRRQKHNKFIPKANSFLFILIKNLIYGRWRWLCNYNQRDPKCLTLTPNLLLLTNWSSVWDYDVCLYGKLLLLWNICFLTACHILELL